MEFSTKDLQKLVPKMREKGFYLPQQNRKIDWSAYTLNQINDIIDTLHFIKAEVDKIKLIKGKKSRGKPPVSPIILAKIILFAELFHIPERKCEGWIVLIGHHLGIEERVDDRVIGKAYQNPIVISILATVFNNNISNDGKMCGDGSGLEKTRKKNYESQKHIKNTKNCIYLTTVVDSREIVQGFDLGEYDECAAMRIIIPEIKENLKKDCVNLLKKFKVTLDAGFVDKKLAQLIADSGIIPYIFPKKNTVLKSKGYPAWKKMLINLVRDVQNWLKEYHIRSHSESFHSSFKRIFGIISKIKYDAIYIQVLCRIIHNNRRKLSYFNLAEGVC